MRFPSGSLRRWAILLLPVALCSPALTEEGQTLARLSYQMPPERIREFTLTYEEAIAPRFQAEGLVASSRRDRATGDSLFTRLFEFGSLTDFAVWRDAMYAGANSDEHREMVETFGITRSSFALYESPAGPGQTTVAGPGQGHWRSYDMSDGLPASGIMAILQDREGNLWFGTQGGGAVRFDGQSFTTFSVKDGLLGSSVRNILQDGDGDLWFTTETPYRSPSRTAVCRFDGQRFATFAQMEGMPNGDVNSMLEDEDGDIWFATMEGLCRFDGQRLTTFTTEDGLPTGTVGSLLEDRQGLLWIWTAFGLCRFDGQRFTTFTFEDGLPTDTVNSLLEDRQGNIWVATGNGWSGGKGLCRYDGQHFETFTTQDGLPTDTVGNLLEDRQGDLWIGTPGFGVCRFDGQRFTTFTSQDGLAGGFISSSLVDGEGNLWFGTNAGVSRYTGQQTTTFTTADGLAGDEIRQVLQDRQGRIWVTTRQTEVTCYDGRAFTNYSSVDGLTGTAMLEDHRGDLWFSQPSGWADLWYPGVRRYDGRNITGFTAADGLPGGGVGGFLEDHQGGLLIGASGGLCRYDGQSFDTVTTWDTRELSLGVTSQILEDRHGGLWFGTGRGPLRVDGGTATILTADDGEEIPNVWSLLEDPSGDLWFGTFGSGLYRYDGQTFQIFTAEDGLPGNCFMYTSLVDDDGHLWFGTDGGGAVRYDGRVFQSFTEADGLAGNVVRSIIQDRDGSFWIGCSGGLTHFQPPPASPPPVFVDAVVAGHRREGVSTLSLPSSIGLVAFEFHGVSFKTRPGGMVYRYRLRGHDDEWHATRDGRVEYEDLPRGQYTFEVQAVDRDLVYSETPARVELRVHLPYERLGLLSALAVALLLIAWQTTRVLGRDRRLQQANYAMSAANTELSQVNTEFRKANQQLEVANREIREATRRKSDFLARMSHDLRTPMNAIIGYTRLLLRKTRDRLDERQLRNLENIQTSSHNLLNLINEILDLSRVEAGRIEINPQDVDLKQLAEECASTVEPLVGSQVVFRRELGEVRGVRTDGEILRKVLMNLLGNAVKFTEAGSISLALAPRGDQVALAVTDTGMGIPAEDLPDIFEEFRQAGRQGSTEKEGTGLGLAIAKKSVDLLGGTLSAESEVGKGTTFSIVIGDYPAT